MTGILKVDSIQSSGGTAAMTIDSSGHVLTPARPAFRAEKRASNQSAPSTSKVTFEHEAFDIGGNYNTSTSKYVVPVAGVYFFQAILRIVADGGTLDYGKVMLYINGSHHSDLQFIQTSSNNMSNSHLSGSCLVQLSANDEAEIYSEISGSNPLVHAHSTGGRTFFTGYLIG